MKLNIFPSIVSTRGASWEDQIKEVQKLNLQEVCLFLTCLKYDQRQKLYTLLAKTSVKTIPLLHLRSDMTLEEIDFLADNYKISAINIHSRKLYPFSFDLATSKYKNQIFVENTVRPLDENEINKFGGICVDYSHLEDNKKQKNSIYYQWIDAMQKYPLGCGHIAAFKDKKIDFGNGYISYSAHKLDKLSEMDYLTSIDPKLFASILALELENSISEQLKIRDYINKILS